MKLALIRTLLAAVISLWLTTSAGAGYDDGWAAYKRGDYATALEEFLPLANEGNFISQFILGIMYRVGQGVPQDYAEAVKWYRLAAEQDFAPAQSSLGIMYREGQGVLQDYIQAHMWFNLAAIHSGEGGRENRDLIAKKMTSAQITEAQRLAREWLEDHGE